MKTLKTNPELMTVIINIQMMNEKLNFSYDKIKDFKRLEKLSEEELYDEQTRTIHLYNHSFNK